MNVRMLVGLAVLLAAAVPARAKAAGYTGIVVAKQPHHGSFVLAGPGGAGLTVHGLLRRAAPGLRVTVTGTRLRDRTVRASRVLARGRVRRLTLRGVVVRRLPRETLVATGRSVVVVRRSPRRTAAVEHGGLRAGQIARFRVRFDDDDLVETAPPVALGQAATVRIEGTLVSVSPFVVSVEGLPVTITVPAGTTLPAGLAAGRRIELDVQVGGADVFTLAGIDEAGNASPFADDEIELKGVVVGSTATRLVVSSGGGTVAFAPPAGTTLPVLAPGVLVEVRGIEANGVVTLERVHVEDDSGGGDDHGGDSHGGGHGGDDGGGGR